MASGTLYAPLVDSTLPSFIAEETNSLKFYFSFSTISTRTDEIVSAHVSICNQATGESVIKEEEFDSSTNGKLGYLILDGGIQYDSANNVYFVEIKDKYIKNHWQPGYIYKMQIRLSTALYSTEKNWMSVNADNFSEWSTYCTVKAIGRPVIKIPIMGGFDSSYKTITNSNPQDKDLYFMKTSTIDFRGSYSNDDLSEGLYSYKVELYDENDELLDTSKDKYANRFTSINQFSYTIKYNLENRKQYKIKFSYVTNNKYTETYYFDIVFNQPQMEIANLAIYSLENIDSASVDVQKDFNNSTSLGYEEDTGQIGIKIVGNDIYFNGNICLRRTDSKSNYTIWDDIRIIPFKGFLSDIPMMFDNTIESGFFYKYGVQLINTFGERYLMVIGKDAEGNDLIISRDFYYSFLVGKGGRQLALKYNNTFDKYGYNIAETKFDTLGGKYPVISRNAITEYRNFPMNTLISFNMDEEKLFLSEEEIYEYDTESYIKQRLDKNYGTYDYQREKNFREKVLAFFRDGEPKLFRSPTEGNLIIRITDVFALPETTLDRMIYSVSSQAYEIADATMENYAKFGFFKIGEIKTTTEEEKNDQILLKLTKTDNEILNKIIKKYENVNEHIVGKQYNVTAIKNLSIEFLSPASEVINSAGVHLSGFNMLLDNKTLITIPEVTTNKYIFDDKIVFGKTNSIEIVDLNQDIEVLVDYVVDTHVSSTETLNINRRRVSNQVAQLDIVCKPRENIIDIIKKKYHLIWKNNITRELENIFYLAIETEPGVCFKINTSDNDEPQLINSTGVLVLDDLDVKELIYVNKEDGSEHPIHALIDYYCTVSMTSY